MIWKIYKSEKWFQVLIPYNLASIAVAWWYLKLWLFFIFNTLMHKDRNGQKNFKNLATFNPFMHNVVKWSNIL